MDQGCKATKCKGKSLIGDKKVLQLDVDQNKWNTIGTLKQARLGYSSAVEVPSYVCDFLELREKINSTVPTESLKTLSWKEIEEGVVTVQETTESKIVGPECLSDCDFDLTRTTEETNVVEKSMTLFVKSCSLSLQNDFFHCMYFFFLMYIALKNIQEKTVVMP